MSSARRVVAGLTAGGLVLLTGCGSIDQAASAEGLARNDLASELVGALDGAAGLTFTAGYRLTGGHTASLTQAQDPARTAYDYPGGRLIVTTDAVTRCAAGLCTRSAAGTPPPLTAPHRGGMIAPATVLSLLNDAALDPAATVASRDTTVAGHHATCVDITGLAGPRTRTFSTCVTTDGVLGTFTGEISGTSFDVALTTYSSRVSDDAFAPPPNARVVSS